jgi:hypothetical protein
MGGDIVGIRVDPDCLAKSRSASCQPARRVCDSSFLWVRVKARKTAGCRGSWVTYPCSALTSMHAFSSPLAYNDGMKQTLGWFRSPPRMGLSRHCATDFGQ